MSFVSPIQCGSEQHKGISTRELESLGTALEASSTVHLLAPTDSNPSHMHSTLTPSQDPPKSHPITVLKYRIWSSESGPGGNDTPWE